MEELIGQYADKPTHSRSLKSHWVTRGLVSCLTSNFLKLWKDTVHWNYNLIKYWHCIDSEIYLKSDLELL